jgi:hypothetical protein
MWLDPAGLKSGTSRMSIVSQIERPPPEELLL